MGNFGSKGKGLKLEGEKKRKSMNVCYKHVCVLCESPTASVSMDDHLRAIGNDLFRSGQYEEALEIYTAIIERNNGSNPVSYTNRANTFMRLKRFRDAMEDCLKALALTPDSLKGHYYLGQCLCELGRYDEGLVYLNKALTLSRQDGSGKHEREVLKIIGIWQQRRRQVLGEIQREKDLYLRMSLLQLIKEEKIRKVQALKDSGEVLGKKGGLITRHYSKELRDNVSNVAKCYDAIATDTEQIFDKLFELQEKPEVPEYMCCKITLSLMEDPVITPSGITYERRVIEEHLRRGHSFDPTTREPLTPSDLIPNLALREAIEHFVTKNSLDYLPNDIPVNADFAAE